MRDRGEVFFFVGLRELNFFLFLLFLAFPFGLFRTLSVTAEPGCFVSFICFLVRGHLPVTDGEM